MEQNLSIQYNALNKESYDSLAAYVVTIPATVTLHPSVHTIVIPDNAAKEVGQFIDDEGLDFHIHPTEVDDEHLCELIDNETTDAATLRKIIHRMREHGESHRKMFAEIQDAYSKAEKERDVLKKEYLSYKEMFRDKANQYDRVKDQVKAISVLVGAIFPDR